jgi:hypothetical protein
LTGIDLNVPVYRYCLTPETEAYVKIQELASRLSTCFHRFRFRLTNIRFGKQNSDIDGESDRKTIQNVDRSIVLLSFQVAYYAPIHLRINGKILLRQFLRCTDPAEIPCYALASVHQCMATSLHSRNPSDISDTLQ